MKTDPERRAELLAKLAKIDAREQNRTARKASKDVRRMEADLRVLERIKDEGYGNGATIGEIVQDRIEDLKAARAQAVKQ